MHSLAGCKQGPDHRPVPGPSRREHTSTCPIALALDVVGDRWSLLILRDLLLRGMRRFSEFADGPEGIVFNVLTDRLRRLEDAGIVVREADPDDRRRFLYRATPRGADLIPVLVELIDWGSRHGSGRRAPAAFARRLAADRAGFLAELRARALARDPR